MRSKPVSVWNRFHVTPPSQKEEKNNKDKNDKDGYADINPHFQSRDSEDDSGSADPIGEAGGPVDEGVVGRLLGDVVWLKNEGVGSHVRVERSFDCHAIIQASIHASPPDIRVEPPNNSSR
jgi:hypothetical protein